MLIDEPGVVSHPIVLILVNQRERFTANFVLFEMVKWDPFETSLIIDAAFSYKILSNNIELNEGKHISWFIIRFLSGESKETVDDEKEEYHWKSASL